MTASSKTSPSSRVDPCDTGVPLAGGATVSDDTLAHSRPFVLRYYERRREVLMATARDAVAAPTFTEALAAKGHRSSTSPVGTVR